MCKTKLPALRNAIKCNWPIHRAFVWPFSLWKCSSQNNSQRIIYIVFRLPALRHNLCSWYFIFSSEFLCFSICRLRRSTEVHTKLCHESEFRWMNSRRRWTLTLRITHTHTHEQRTSSHIEMKLVVPNGIAANKNCSSDGRQFESISSKKKFGLNFIGLISREIVIFICLLILHRHKFCDGQWKFFGIAYRVTDGKSTFFCCQSSLKFDSSAMDLTRNVTFRSASCLRWML